MIRAIAERPAPPMPTKCTRPSSSAGSSTSGTGTFIGGPPDLEDDAGQPLVGVARHQRRTPRRPSPPAGRGRSARTARGRRPTSGVSVGVVRRAALPRRRRRGGRCAPARRCRSAAARRSPGSPTAAASMTLLAPAAAEHQVGGGVGEVHPVDERARTAYGTSLAARGSPRPAGRRRAAPARRRRPAPRDAPETAWLSRRAPCEPPVTSSVGRSGSRSKNRAGLGAQRGAVEPRDHRAQRQADVLGLRQRGVGEADRDPSGDAGAGLVGQAGHGVLLVERRSAPCGGGRRGRPASRRSRRSRRPRRRRSGRARRRSRGRRRAAGPGP